MLLGTRFTRNSMYKKGTAAIKCVMEKMVYDAVFITEIKVYPLMLIWVNQYFKHVIRNHWSTSVSYFSMSFNPTSQKHL